MFSPDDPKIMKFTKAVAFAEGCINLDESYRTLTLPYRLNNPCDLKVAPSMYHTTGVIKEKLVFQDISTGWNAGAHQMYLMFSNTSKVYNDKMTLLQVAEHYAAENTSAEEEANAVNWSQNLAAFLKLPKVNGKYNTALTLKEVYDKYL